MKTFARASAVALLDDEDGDALDASAYFADPLKERDRPVVPRRAQRQRRRRALGRLRAHCRQQRVARRGA